MSRSSLLGFTWLLLAVSVHAACGRAAGSAAGEGGNAKSSSGPGGNAPSSSSAGMNVDERGGVVTFENMTLTIPAGALTTATPIGIEESPFATPLPLHHFVGKPYELSPSGTIFKIPARASITTDETSGLPSLFVATDGHDWIVASNSSFDLAHKLVTGNIKHFSQAAVQALDACAPTDASCYANPGDCLSQSANNMVHFGLRFDEVRIKAPVTWSGSPLEDVIDHGLLPNWKACGLFGEASNNWVLMVDNTNGSKLSIGSALLSGKPGAYAFEDKKVTLGGPAFDVVSATTQSGLDFVPVSDLPDGSVTYRAKVSAVNLPVTAKGMLIMLLPLKDVELNFQVSPDRTCIGSLDLSNFDATNSCALKTPYRFKEGGTLDAVIYLKEANDIWVSPVNESLCSLLTGDNDGTGHCTIFLGGDACWPPAKPCPNAMAVHVEFSASGVPVQ